jgi:hypothetical protein
MMKWVFLHSDRFGVVNETKLPELCGLVGCDHVGGVSVYINATSTCDCGFSDGFAV